MVIINPDSTALSLLRTHFLKSRLAQSWPPRYAGDEASFRISCRHFTDQKKSKCRPLLNIISTAL